MVVGDGFEPSKADSQLIYSQSPLATWVTYRKEEGEKGTSRCRLQALSAQISILLKARLRTQELSGS